MLGLRPALVCLPPHSIGQWNGDRSSPFRSYSSKGGGPPRGTARLRNTSFSPFLCRSFPLSEFLSFPFPLSRKGERDRQRKGEKRYSERGKGLGWRSHPPGHRPSPFIFFPFPLQRKGEKEVFGRHRCPAAPFRAIRTKGGRPVPIPLPDGMGHPFGRHTSAGRSPNTRVSPPMKNYCN